MYFCQTPGEPYSSPQSSSFRQPGFSRCSSPDTKPHLLSPEALQTLLVPLSFRHPCRHSRSHSFPDPLREFQAVRYSERIPLPVFSPVFLRIQELHKEILPLHSGTTVLWTPPDSMHWRLSADIHLPEDVHKYHCIV